MTGPFGFSSYPGMPFAGTPQQTQAPVLGPQPRPLALAPATPDYTVETTTAPGIKPDAIGYKRDAAGLMAGLAAGSQVAPGNDAASTAVSAGTAAISAGGAAFVASGFNPVVGLVAAGGAGLTSLVSSYLNTRATRKRDRKEARLLSQAEKKQAFRDSVARGDALEQQGYDRNQDKMRTAWAQNVDMLKRITDTMNQNQDLKDRWVAKGFV